MIKLRNILLVLAFVPVLLILLWTIAVPLDLIKERLESSVTGQADGSMTLSLNGLRKGIFFSLYAESLELKIDNSPALIITGFTGRLSPCCLADLRLGFDMKGRIGTGDVSGTIKIPLEGSIRAERAELSEVPYLTRFNTAVNGHVASDIGINGNELRIIFNVPDLAIDDSSSIIPLLNTFTKLQGALTLKGSTIQVDSISLDGTKGYARLKGKIVGNIMDLSLELMPETDKLNTLESMVVGKYIVSPGYYVVPITGPLPR
ncbi:MAG: type II secretion system protein GspN [Nitrospirota bacterium]